jgi:hypothetical protein
MSIYQEIFDKVYTHLEQQGEASALETGACLYRSEDGKMCAVGCLIIDEDYNSDFEGNSVFELIEDYGWKPEGVSRMTPKMVEFLTDLQCAHDEALDGGSIGEWHKEMALIAKSHGLNFKVGEAV